MACETFKTTINGTEYSYTQLPASRSLRLKFKIIKLFSSAVPLLIEGKGKKDDEQIKMFIKAIESVVGSSGGNDVPDLIIECLSSVQVDDDHIDFNKQFSGIMVEMYKVLFWVMKKEYGSFLEEAKGLFAEMKAKEVDGSKSLPQT